MIENINREFSTDKSKDESHLVSYLIEQGLKNPYRVRELIAKSLEFNSLDLRDLVVFTEAASKNYVVTPVIAAMAGARVYAITKDSIYGKAKNIENFACRFADFCNVKDRITVVFEKNKDQISRANIVTNLGFVRPIDNEFLDMMNRNAVISYMCETWEFRGSDLDLRGCKLREIPVLGTNEHYYNLEIFNFIGNLCMKMLFNMDLEVLKNKIIVISNDMFGNAIKESLASNGAEVYLVRDLKSRVNRQYLNDADVIIVADYLSEDTLIGEANAQITAEELRKYSQFVSVIQFAGDVDIKHLEYFNIPYYPKRRVGNFRMGMTLAELGPKPIIDLHTAGLKVGQIMARARLAGHSIEETKKIALEFSPAQDFIN